MNKLVSLQYWTPQATVKDIDFSRVHFWIQLHGLPFENLNVKCAKKILAYIGDVIEIENPYVEGSFIRHFIRARVRLNFLEPLFSGCWVPRRNLPNIWMGVKYEKLQDMCFKCGIIGHEQRTCREEKVMSATDQDVPRYGQRMSVPPARELHEIMEEGERWRQRS